MAIATVLCWIMFAAISRTTALSCELLPRTAWSFAAPAMCAGFVLSFSYIRRLWLRVTVGFVVAVLAGAAAWALSASLFPRFC